MHMSFLHLSSDRNLVQNLSVVKTFMRAKSASDKALKKSFKAVTLCYACKVSGKDSLKEVH